MGWSAVQGGIALALTGGLAWLLWQSGIAAEQLRAAAFLALVAVIAGLILVNRRYSASLAAALGRANPALAIVMGVVAVIMLATQFIPPIADLFGFARISAAEAGMVALLGIGQLVLLERLKPLWSKRLIG